MACVFVFEGSELCGGSASFAFLIYRVVRVQQIIKLPPAQCPGRGMKPLMSGGTCAPPGCGLTALELDDPRYLPDGETRIPGVRLTIQRRSQRFGDSVVTFVSQSIRRLLDEHWDGAALPCKRSSRCPGRAASVADDHVRRLRIQIRPQASGYNFSFASRQKCLFIAPAHRVNVFA